MKTYNGVRGTMANIPYILVDFDTVYVRSNIVRIDTEDFNGFEYDEVQYGLKEYIESLSPNQDVQSIAMLISGIMAEIDFLKQRVIKLEES